MRNRMIFFPRQVQYYYELVEGELDERRAGARVHALLLAKCPQPWFAAEMNSWLGSEQQGILITFATHC